MFTPKIVFFTAALNLALGSSVVLGAGPNLGRPVSQADAAAWDIDIEPSGAGLPLRG